MRQMLERGPQWDSSSLLALSERGQLRLLDFPACKVQLSGTDRGVAILGNPGTRGFGTR